MNDRINIHGTGILVGSHGVILRGPSGAGKSMLALEVLHDAELRRIEAKLVADDRLDLFTKDGALFMAPPPNIAGLIELRGRGIVTRPHVDIAQVHLVVDVGTELVRLVEEEELRTEIEGIVLARCPVPGHDRIGATQQKLLVLEALRALDDGAAA